MSALPSSPSPKVMAIAQMIRTDHPGRDLSLSGIGGVETGADAAEFILLGSDTVQVGGVGQGVIGRVETGADAAEFILLGSDTVQVGAVGQGISTGAGRVCGSGHQHRCR